MNWTKTIGCAAVAAGLWAGTCLGQTYIAEWALTTNYTGTTEFTNSVAVKDLTVGSAVGDRTFNGTWMYANKWAVTTNASPTQCFEISVQAKNSAVLLASGLEVTLRASDKGPAKVKIDYSTDNGKNWSTAYDGKMENDGKPHPMSQEFSATSDGTFKVRIYGYDADSSTGTFGIYANTLKLAGSATSPGSAPVVTLESGLLTAAGNTLESVVRVMPAVEGTTTNAVLEPTPQGACGLADGKFTFTPAPADAGEAGTEYTLTVTAVNPNGTGSAETKVFVMPALPEGSYLTGFEKLQPGKFPEAVDIDGIRWVGSSVNVVTNADLMVGKRCLGFSSGGAYIQTAEKVLPGGIGAVGCLGWLWGSDELDVLPLVVSISDNGTFWTSVGQLDLTGTDGRVAANIPVELASPAYVRLQVPVAVSMRGIDIDNLWISPFVDTTTDYEKFLLKYNVTPRDDLTGEDEDYDGDGYSNIAEMNANPETDPYDETLHP